ncbi:hypothetical protein IJG44_04950 [bacterium]|jgi:hypothetical protein|nr:hypothetical protein [bacterium]
MSQNTEDFNTNPVEREHRSIGQNLWIIFKFIIFTLIKMILVALAAAAWFIALFGVIIKTMGKYQNTFSYIKDEHHIVYHFGNLLSAPFLFLVKFFNSYLRAYLWPAVGGLAILIAIFVLL